MIKNNKGSSIVETVLLTIISILLSIATFTYCYSVITNIIETKNTENYYLIFESSGLSDEEEVVVKYSIDNGLTWVALDLSKSKTSVKLSNSSALVSVTTGNNSLYVIDSYNTNNLNIGVYSTIQVNVNLSVDETVTLMFLWNATNNE